jgi:MHS family proline/betaine transporter-like MFS transporter
MGSWSMVGGVSGIMLGSAVGALTSTVLSPTALDAWGWRLPFLVGLGVGLSGLYLRRHLPAAAPLADEASVPRSPVREAFRTQWRAILRVAGVSVLNAIGFYTVFVYAVTYMEQIVHVRAAEALDLNTLNMGILVLVMPVAGALSDRLGRKPVLLGSALGLLVLAWPLFWLIHHPAWSLMLLGQLGFAVLVGLYLGPIPAMAAEAFPARVRVSALAIGYNAAVGILGGITPMAITSLLAWSHNPLTPAYYLMGAAAVSLAVLISWPETARAPLP